MADKTRLGFRAFADDFASYLDNEHPYICFYVFGSGFQDRDYEPSDLDGGIIVPELVTDKSQILELSRQLNKKSESHGIERKRVNLNLIDLESARDSRFLSYDSSYTSYFFKKARSLTQNNSIPLLRGINFRYGTLESAAFNLRSLRNDFLDFSYLVSEGGDVEKQVRTALSKTEALPKKLHEIYGVRKTGEGIIIEDKYEAVARLKEILPGFDTSFFPQIRLMLRQRRLEQVLDSQELTLRAWTTALTTFEQLIKAYIEIYPPKKIIAETEI